MQCKEIKRLRQEFVKNLLIEMLQKKLKEVDHVDIFNIIEDMFKHLNKDEEGDF